MIITAGERMVKDLHRFVREDLHCCREDGRKVLLFRGERGKMCTDSAGAVGNLYCFMGTVGIFSLCRRGVEEEDLHLWKERESWERFSLLKGMLLDKEQGGKSLTVGEVKKPLFLEKQRKIFTSEEAIGNEILQSH